MGVSPYDCAYYRLKNPVLFVQPELQVGDAFLHQAIQQCKEAENRSLLEPSVTVVRILATQFSPDHAYLVIDLPDLFLATEELRENHATLFQCLQLTVKHLGEWSSIDVTENLKGGTWTKEITELPIEFTVIRDALAQPRRHNACDTEGDKNFQMLQQWYKAQFERTFIPDETHSCTPVCPRELAAFYQTLEYFDNYVLWIARSTATPVKASNFVVHFLQPPFVSFSSNFEYQQKVPWSFPIFLDAVNHPNAFRRFQPRNYCTVSSPQFGIPLVICEAGSDASRGNRCGLLLQAVALARAGQFLLRSGSQKKFFVVALYLDARMVVYEYIVMQTEGNTQSDHKPVSICEQTFDLKLADRRVDFLREMYNLATHISALLSELDVTKEQDLRAIHMAAGKVVSVGRRGIHGEDEDEENLGAFEADV